MMKRGRVLRGLAGIVLVMFGGSGCNTASPAPQPFEKRTLAPGFIDRHIRDIAVMPLQGEAFDATGEESVPPAAVLREAFRRYLIDDRRYAVPRSEWVDARADDGVAALDTDAVLEGRIDQWDAESLVSRGVVYVGGEFRLLAAADGAELWSYRCRNVPVIVQRPRLPAKATDSTLEAARWFAKWVLGDIPKP